ncbi:MULTISPECIES: hypothetical protein [unclassified Picosynechococcus]|uniref:hypothetical protein n=1 Tax=unclassified Picosynechococcus TaxID=3079910 RepID=UPI00117C7E38|nr:MULTISPECIES: hypothetical protein [unclassified Picosynechococcus]
MLYSIPGVAISPRAVLELGSNQAITFLITAGDEFFLVVLYTLFRGGNTKPWRFIDLFTLARRSPS